MCGLQRGSLSYFESKVIVMMLAGSPWEKLNHLNTCSFLSLSSNKDEQWFSENLDD